MSNQGQLACLYLLTTKQVLIMYLHTQVPLLSGVTVAVFTDAKPKPCILEEESSLGGLHFPSRHRRKARGRPRRRPE